MMRKAADLKGKNSSGSDVVSSSGSAKPKKQDDTSTVRIRELLEHCDALEREIQINAERYRVEIARLKQLASSNVQNKGQAAHFTHNNSDMGHQFPDYYASENGSSSEKEALLKAAKDFSLSRDWANAAVSYSSYLRKFPIQPSAWKQYGHALKEDGRLDLAEKAYYRALALRPSDADLAQHLGDLLVRNGKTEEARFILNGGNQLAPSNAEIANALERLGVTPIKSSDKPDAKVRSLGYFEKRRAKKLRGDAQRAARSQNWREAAHLYQKLTVLMPFENKYVIQMGHAFKESGQFSDAESAYRSVIAKDPLNSDAYLHLGHILKLQGRGSESRDAYKMSLQCWPDNRDALDEV